MQKKIKNSFWSECFGCVEPLMRDFLKKNPENLLYSNFWGSHFFKRNNLPCNSNNFRTMSKCFSHPVELMQKNQDDRTDFISYEDLRARQGPNIELNEYTEIKYIITRTIRQLGTDLGRIKINLPFQPALISLLTLSKKGCSKWTSLLKDRAGTNASQVRLEEKWEGKLGARLGPVFWDSTYNRTAEIFFDNKLKWLQYQITRGVLKTNHIISKFLPNIIDSCSFCNTNEETILHLFWDCQVTQNFINNITNYLQPKWPNIIENLNKKKPFFLARLWKKVGEQITFYFCT